jgi:hypothetical protein
MQPIAFVQELQRLHEVGYLDKPNTHLVPHTIQNNKTGQKKVYGRRVKPGSEVISQIWTVSKPRSKTEKIIIFFFSTQGHFEWVKTGDQIEILATEHNMNPTMYNIVRPDQGSDTPKRFEGLTFKGVWRIVPLSL